MAELDDEEEWEGEAESEEAESDEERTRLSNRKKQWTTLSHNGVIFPEPYKSDPRTNTISIKGDKIVMSLAQEEMAVAWAKKIGTPYVEDPVFQKNFLTDFLKLFPAKYRDAKISDIIFPTLPEKVELTKEQKKALAAERKKKRLELKEKFGYALVDGVKTEIANWVVEPPGIYMGRGCLAKDTIVKTVGSYKYVQDLTTEDMIATHHGSSHMFYRPVSSIARQGIRPLYRIRTRTHSIRATGNHPFLTLRVEKIRQRNSNGTFDGVKFPATLQWIPLSKLEEGDYVVTAKRYQTLGTSKYSKAASRTFNGSIITPNFAQLLGYYVGDGFLFKKRKNDVVTGICFVEGHPKLLKKYSKLCEVTLGIPPTITVHNGGNAWRILISSVELAKVFQTFGITGTALSKRVPEWVYSLADDLKVAFLRGYIDANGNYFVSKVKGVEYAHFGLESPNKRLIEDMRELATSAGLQTSNITSRHRHGFAFGTHYRFFVSEYNSVRRILGETDSLEGKRSKLYSLDNRQKDLRSKWDWSRLHILDSDFFCLEKILDIEEAGRGVVYDVSMTNKMDPNFVANGFVVHNSHPLRGHWKPRIFEEDVTLNLDKNAKAPQGRWKIVHEPQNMWIASWTDKLTGKVKYVWLHDSSSLRQMRDKSKYDKARRLEKDIRRVESFILKAMRSKELKKRKIATACFLIYRLAMRVGDEKDEDEADTVGASTLRVEHLIFPKPNVVDFDFFGKDYVRWQKRLEVSPNENVAIENLKEFCKDKQPEELIFDGITSRNVNEFLSKASQGLTAKVFRTFLATSVVKDYLREHSTFPEGTPEYDKVYEARLANLEAAMKCNHKRTPPKTYEQTLQKKKDRLAQLEKSEPKTDKQRASLNLRIAKLKRQIALSEQTRDYNLNTSLRNYIDPRVFKTWADRINLDWKILYTATLQRKMAWVDGGATTPPVQTSEPAEVTVKVEQKR
jgi:intein/homing endonuclease/DNA topoisomerase IB